ncbi:MAG: hypothetical protein V1740_00535 [Candidatus Woesearchaeota archaeon]
MVLLSPLGIITPITPGQIPLFLMPCFIKKTECSDDIVRVARALNDTNWIHDPKKVEKPVSPAFKLGAALFDGISTLIEMYDGLGYDSGNLKLARVYMDFKDFTFSGDDLEGILIFKEQPRNGQFSINGRLTKKSSDSKSVDRAEFVYSSRPLSTGVIPDDENNHISQIDENAGKLFCNAIKPDNVHFYEDQHPRNMPCLPHPFFLLGQITPPLLDFYHNDVKVHHDIVGNGDLTPVIRSLDFEFFSGFQNLRYGSDIVMRTAYFVKQNHKFPICNAMVLAGDSGGVLAYKADVKIIMCLTDEMQKQLGYKQ